MHVSLPHLLSLCSPTPLSFLSLSLCSPSSPPLPFHIHDSLSHKVCLIIPPLISQSHMLPYHTSAAGTPAASTSPSAEMPSAAAISSVPTFSLSGPTRPTYTSPSVSSSVASVLSLAEWVSLLAQQLPSVTGHQTSRVSPLILSPAFPPIPGKVIEKIQRGENPDLKEILSDNVALSKRLHFVLPL